MHLFGVFQAHRTLSNLLEPHHYRDSKVCRVLSDEFRVVRQHRTFSIYIVTGETRSAGCLCTSSGWFKHIEPSRTTSLQRDSKVCRVFSHEFGVVRLNRTFSIYIVVGETRCAGCLCTSSGWFKHIEPPRTFSNHIITEIARCVRVLSHEFGVVRLHRTFSIHIVTGETRCAGCLCTSSWWFKHIEPSSNLLEPHHYRDSKVCRVLSHEFRVVRPYRTFSIYIVTGETRYAGCLCTS